jgi:DNA-binding MarR family transcriptional regulator
LSIQEARALIVLAQHRTMRVSALADVTCIEASALSHMLRGLSRRGLLTRNRAKQDNRSVDVALTVTGSHLAQVCVALSRKHEATLLRRFSEKDRSALRAMLRRMYDNAAAWSDGAGLNLRPAKGSANAIIAKTGCAPTRAR